MKLAIVGSRAFSALGLVKSFVCKQEFGTVIISGGAAGVDRMAEVTAHLIGFGTMIYKAEWDKYGQGAGFKRNLTIVEKADEVVAFWDGRSKGTKHTMDLAEKAGKLRAVIYAY